MGPVTQSGNWVAQLFPQHALPCCKESHGPGWRTDASPLPTPRVARRAMRAGEATCPPHPLAFCVGDHLVRGFVGCSALSMHRASFSNRPRCRYIEQRSGRWGHFIWPILFNNLHHQLFNWAPQLQRNADLFRLFERQFQQRDGRVCPDC